MFVGLHGPSGIHLPQRNDPLDNLLVQAHSAQKLSDLALKVLTFGPRNYSWVFRASGVSSGTRKLLARM